MGERGRQDDHAPREHTPRGRHTARPHPPHEPPPPPGDGLVHIHDLAGRLRGLGFVADHHGTVVTSHETVDGLPRLVLRTATGDRSHVVGADAVIPLPERDLALVHADGLGVDPLPLTVRDRVETGAYVRITAGCPREARVLGATEVTYTATDRCHRIDDALELAIGTAGRDALRLGGGAAGGPVRDAGTGAVVAVVGTALRSGQRECGFAVSLRPAGDGPLAGLLARNAATVPAYGADLNLAGVLELAATSVGQDGPRGVLEGTGGGAPDGRPGWAAGVRAPGEAEPVEREAVLWHLTAFERGPAAVLALVGPPGSGRTTQLAALAARRHRGVAVAGDAGRVPCAPEAGEGRTSVVDAGAVGVSASWLRGAGPGGGLGEGLGLGAGPDPCPGSDVAGDVSAVGGSAAVLGGGGAGVGGVGAGVRGAGVGAGGVRAGVGGVGGAVAGAGSVRAGVGGVAAVVGGGPAPTLWLRGADLREDDGSIADAVRRAVERAARIVAAAGSRSAPPDDLTPERLARVAREAGRPLLLLLDGPEEMPPVLTHRLRAWTERTAAWLRETDTRLVVACRAEYWESAGAEFPAELLYRPAVEETPWPGGPPCVPLGDLTEAEARLVRARHRIPDGALAEADARHPLTLRLIAEVRAAIPGAPCPSPLDHHDVFSAHLDLMCLRVAVRLAAENGLRGTAVRRLAARVAGQVHEAARRNLGPAQGELDRTAFETVFPWGPAPGRLGGGTGWASAVLAEGLFVPAGDGYRFAHEEFADWIQGLHLDLDEALRALVHRPRTAGPAHPPPVPHHRIGPVVQSLLCVARQQGTAELAARLGELAQALDADPHSWWAARLLREVLLRVPDATPYLAVLRRLADSVVDRRRQQPYVPGDFGPGFWTGLRLPEAERLDLLRRLVLADPAPQAAPGPRYLDAVAGLLAAAPTAVQPYLVRWFDDERPLPATPHATVAAAAQALLHTHRHHAVDDLTELLADSAHGRAGELLAVLAEEEPSAICRAVDRWVHDERPDRRATALAYGLRAAPHVRSEADRELLRYAALALLARPADTALHGGALGLLVRDPRTRAHHLPRALDHFRAGDPHLPPSALAAALPTHPEPVLDAFRARLHLTPDAGGLLSTLADVTTPALVPRVAALIREAVALRPDLAGAVAEYADRRLDHGPAARAVLFPLVTDLLDGGPSPAPTALRAALAGVLAAPGALRRELREVLLSVERDPAVLEALLRAAARKAPDDLRELVHGLGGLLVRTPDGATRFDRILVELGREVPGFAARVAGWLAEAPGDWAAVIGPSSRRMLENLAGARVPA
ncbi:serine protease [Streptomyces sp. JB150]|uniref:serine protease n=1 Tax=Streptomyces sp. JB150 TaxID=2714844 RepID=UPI001F0DC358|nr:serine protease [Streptomyces sp. JB150]